MNNIREALSRKLGPLPAWVWAVVAGVGLYIYRQHKAAQGGGGGDQTSPADTLSYYGPYGQQYSPIQGGEFGSGDPTGGPPTINIYDHPGKKAKKGHKHHKRHPKPKHKKKVTRHSHRPRSHTTHPAHHRHRSSGGAGLGTTRPRRHR